MTFVSEVIRTLSMRNQWRIELRPWSCPLEWVVKSNYC